MAQHSTIIPPVPVDRERSVEDHEYELDDDRDTLVEEQPPSVAPNQAEAESTVEAGNSFLPDQTAAHADERWLRIQGQFVDDPRKSVGEAHALVGELTQRIVDAFAKERADLEQQWSKGDDVSTEDLRVCLQRYRGFFSRLLPSVTELEQRGGKST